MTRLHAADTKPVADRAERTLALRTRTATDFVVRFTSATTALNGFATTAAVFFAADLTRVQTDGLGASAGAGVAGTSAGVAAFGAAGRAR